VSDESLSDAIERARTRIGDRPMYTVTQPSGPTLRDRASCALAGHQWWLIMGMSVCGRCGTRSVPSHRADRPAGESDA
jgi:hypothetical protein